MKLNKSFLIAFAVCALAAVPSFGSPIVLGLNSNVMVGVNTIDFTNNYPTSTTFVPAPQYGNFQVQSPVGDIFAANGVSSGEFGQIQSISQAFEPVRPPQFDNPYMNTPFITFNSGGSNLQLFLTAVLQGNDGPGVPYIFTATPNGLVVSFNIDGYVLNTTTNSRTPYTGTFSATFNGVTGTPTLPLQTPVSATFSLVAVPGVPEPASLLLLGTGLLGVGLVARRKVRG